MNFAGFYNLYLPSVELYNKLKLNLPEIKAQRELLSLELGSWRRHKFGNL